MANLSTSDYIIFTSLYLPVLSLSLMGKREFKPVKRMKGLDKASEATVNFLTLPKMIETEYDTGKGPNGKSKWELTIEVLEHPAGLKGEWVWQTTCEVIRVDIYNLVLECLEKKFKVSALLEDLQLNSWKIMRDEQGLTSLKEI